MQTHNIIATSGFHIHFSCVSSFSRAVHIRLQPENDDYDPIIVKDVAILGEVIGVFRLF